MPRATPSPTRMTDGMRDQVRGALKQLEITYRLRAKSMRDEYQQERDRLEGILESPVVPRTQF